MWENSTRIGCGSSAFPNCKKALLVCIYEPKGNIKEEALMTDEQFSNLQTSGDIVESCQRLLSFNEQITHICKKKSHSVFGLGSIKYKLSKKMNKI